VEARFHLRASVAGQRVEIFRGDQGEDDRFHER
jgi:hypothetical protein